MSIPEFLTYAENRAYQQNNKLIAQFIVEFLEQSYDAYTTKLELDKAIEGLKD